MSSLASDSMATDRAVTNARAVLKSGSHPHRHPHEAVLAEALGLRFVTAAAARVPSYFLDAVALVKGSSCCDKFSETAEVAVRFSHVLTYFAWNFALLHAVRQLAPSLELVSHQIPAFCQRHPVIFYAALRAYSLATSAWNSYASYKFPDATAVPCVTLIKGVGDGTLAIAFAT